MGRASCPQLIGISFQPDRATAAGSGFDPYFNTFMPTLLGIISANLVRTLATNRPNQNES